jgi:RNA polymerase sigma-70 factor (ECF subfamily)
MRARTDDELLAATPRDPDAFAELYRRHAAPLTRYFLRRVGGNAEAAADLTAETFAAALHRVRRFDAKKGTAPMWLYGIAGRELAGFYESGAVADRARRRLKIPRIELDDEALERVVEVASSEAVGRRLAELLDQLPDDQRAAVQARVIEERPYEDAAERKRVSRGLALMRKQMEDDR